MKKLITIILILALLLPAAALADDPYIEKHYVLQLERVGTKIDSSLFNFDTIAIDLTWRQGAMAACSSRTE